MLSRVDYFPCHQNVRIKDFPIKNKYMQYGISRHNAHCWAQITASSENKGAARHLHGAQNHQVPALSLQNPDNKKEEKSQKGRNMVCASKRSSGLWIAGDANDKGFLLQYFLTLKRSREREHTLTSLTEKRDGLRVRRTPVCPFFFFFNKCHKGNMPCDHTHTSCAYHSVI